MYVNLYTLYMNLYEFMFSVYAFTFTGMNVYQIIFTVYVLSAQTLKNVMLARRAAMFKAHRRSSPPEVRQLSREFPDLCEGGGKI